MSVTAAGQFHHSRIYTSEPAGSEVKNRTQRFMTLAYEVFNYVRGFPATDVAGICIEGYAHGANMSGVTDRAEYGGILRMLIVPLGIPIYEVAPTALKKWTHGKGNGDKTPVIARMTDEFKLKLTTNDEYDAAVLARIALQVAGLEEPQTAYRREVVEVVKHGKPKPVKRRKGAA